MKFHSHAQELATAEALRHPYKAVAFDIDGTLTELSRFSIPESLKATLLSLPIDLPLALCTGRPLDYIQSKLDHLLSGAPDEAAQRKRWFVLAENGGAGYVYHPRKNTYEPFFEIPWPDNQITKETLEAFIKDKFGLHVQFLTRTHSVVVRCHAWIYFFPRLVRALSRRTSHQLLRLLKTMEHDRHLTVQDSGIGNLLIPVASGKGKAVARWAKHLGLPLKDILVIGDQPRPGSNDDEFLCGDFGTPFTVGELTDSLYPFPVLDDTGRRMKGPRGTEELLRKIFT